MKIIPLTMGMFALVDDTDFDFLMQWNWFAANYRTEKSGRPPRFYAARKGIEGKPNTHLKMADVIWERHYGPIPEGHLIDHVNNFSLDNRLWVDGKPQLECVTLAENTRRSHIMSPRRRYKKEEQCAVEKTSTEQCSS